MRQFKIIIAAVMTLAVSLNIYAQESTLLPTAPLKPYDKVYIDADMEVKLVKCDESQPLRITYDLGDSDHEKFKFSTKQGGTLSVILPPNPKSMKPATATIYYHSIESLNIRGAKVTVDRLESKILDIKVNYQGSLDGSIIAEDIAMSVQSDSRVEISGRCKYLTLDAASRSKVELRAIEITSAIINTSSGAVVALNAGDRLEVKAGAGSAINYWGVPNILRENKAFMSGSLTKQE
ncbi:MAG: DUF2807 domain-containing protein [Rikenellaceae bacterium]